MKGRILVWPLVAVLALALVGQVVRWRSRMEAGRLLARVEALSTMVTERGKRKMPGRLLQENLESLRRAAALDPVEVGVPIARGSQHLLSGSPEAAIAPYRAAAALEPRPEIYFNLGRAEWMARRPEDARRDLALALRLDPRLAEVLPPEMR